MDRSGSLSELEVIGIAAAAAAALGGIVVALGRGQQAASNQQSGLAALASNVNVGKLDTGQVRQSATRAVQEVGRHLPEVQDAGRDLGERATRSATKAIKPARKELKRTARQAARKVREVESQAPTRDEAGALMRDIMGAVTGGLRQYAQQATSRAESVGAQARTRREQSELDIGSKLRESVLPALQSAAATTAHRTEDALCAVRERAATVSEAGDTSDGRVSKVTSQVSDTSQHVVSETTQAAKDTFATLLWLVVASTVVYFVMMSDERRERMKAAMCGGLEQVRLLALDFKGYDPEM